MKTRKIYIIITILVVFLALTYNFIRLSNHKQTNTVNTTNKEIEKVQFTSQSNLVSQSIEKIVLYDSLNVEEKKYTSLAISKVNNKIPILMYHSIIYEKGNSLRVSKENFRKQMKYLKDNKYTPLTLDELYIYMKTGKILPEKPIVITFDDGYKDNYTNALPILKEFKFKATVFVIAGAIDKEKDFLTTSELMSMDANNLRIESHTTAHEHLTKISYKDDLKTMISSKVKLEKILNRKINYIAYPYGEYNNTTIKAAKESGYKLAMSTDFGWIDKNSNIYSLGRIFVNANFTFEEFKAKLNNDQLKASEIKNKEKLEQKWKKGYDEFFNKKYKLAIETEKQVIKEEPDFYKAYAVMGIALAYSGDYKNGMKQIDQALKLKPDYGYARFNKALANELFNNYDEAIIWYKKALEVEKFEWSYYGIASIYGRKGDVSNTIKYLKLAIAINPGVKTAAKAEEDFDNVRTSIKFIELIK